MLTEERTWSAIICLRGALKSLRLQKRTLPVKSICGRLPGLLAQTHQPEVVFLGRPDDVEIIREGGRGDGPKIRVSLEVAGQVVSLHYGLEDLLGLVNSPPPNKPEPQAPVGNWKRTTVHA